MFLRWNMKKNDNIIWGIVFIIVGIIFGLKALGIFDFNIFFKDGGLYL